MKTVLLWLLLSSTAWGQFVSVGNNGQPGFGLGLPEQWLMHDGSGQAFADATPNDNTITTTDITWGTGNGVTSPTFNGSTSTGVAAQVPITNFDGTQPFSVSIWINSALTNPEEALISTLNPASNFQGWELTTTGLTSPTFLLVNTFPSNALEVVSVAGLLASETTNVIVTYSAATKTASDVSFYINGVLSPNQSLENSFSASSASGLPIHVGSRSDGSVPYGGSMSNLQIFSGVLTSGQIAAIQTAGP
jgi:Concanavalin A-like lectin/glucanases superfamily